MPEQDARPVAGTPRARIDSPAAPQGSGSHEGVQIRPHGGGVQVSVGSDPSGAAAGCGGSLWVTTGKKSPVSSRSSVAGCLVSGAMDRPGLQITATAERFLKHIGRTEASAYGAPTAVTRSVTGGVSSDTVESSYGWGPRLGSRGIGRPTLPYRFPARWRTFEAARTCLGNRSGGKSRFHVQRLQPHPACITPTRTMCGLDAYKNQTIMPYQFAHCKQLLAA